MNTVTKIMLFQYLPAYINKQITFIKALINGTFDKRKARENDIIENINYFASTVPKTKHALISLSPMAYLTAISEYPEIKHFNAAGFTYEMVKVLNENGYLVDIVNLNCKTFVPEKNYDLFLGHGGNCRLIIDNLKKRTKVIQYTAGAYWKEFNRESQERYDYFCTRKNLTQIMNFKRSVDCSPDGEEYLISKADLILIANYPRTINGYGNYISKFFIIGWAAYINDLMSINIADKNFERGRNNFIYVGGTGGNIQKGFDLLIETFVKCPELHLYIYCKVEDEILKYYRHELESNNIHYIYHYRFRPFNHKLKEVLKNINFTIHAPINTGTGTAFTGSLGVGLIPVGYIDLAAPEDSCVLTDSFDIESLIECVKEASGKSAQWCKRASELTIDNFRKNWSLESFRHNLTNLLQLLGKA